MEDETTRFGLRPDLEAALAYIQALPEPLASEGAATLQRWLAVLSSMDDEARLSVAQLGELGTDLKVVHKLVHIG